MDPVSIKTTGLTSYLDYYPSRQAHTVVLLGAEVSLQRSHKTTLHSYYTGQLGLWQCPREFPMDEELGKANPL